MKLRELTGGEAAVLKTPCDLGCWGATEQLWNAFHNLKSSRSPEASAFLGLRVIVETYSTVGRSLPLRLLGVWEK